MNVLENPIHITYHINIQDPAGSIHTSPEPGKRAFKAFWYAIRMEVLQISVRVCSPGKVLWKKRRDSCVLVDDIISKDNIESI